MNTRTMTQTQIRLAGLRALARELGPVGRVRFLQQLETGAGDYSAERHRWLDQQDVQAIARTVWERKAAAWD